MINSVACLRSPASLARPTADVAVPMARKPWMHGIGVANGPAAAEAAHAYTRLIPPRGAPVV
jgi:hypothetical protein